MTDGAKRLRVPPQPFLHRLCWPLGDLGLHQDRWWYSGSEDGASQEAQQARRLSIGSGARGSGVKHRRLRLTSMTSPNLRCRVAAMLARIACSTVFTTHGRWKAQRQPAWQVLQGGHGSGGWRQAAAGGRGSQAAGAAHLPSGSPMPTSSASPPSRSRQAALPRAFDRRGAQSTLLVAAAEFWAAQLLGGGLGAHPCELGASAEGWGWLSRCRSALAAADQPVKAVTTPDLTLQGPGERG